MATHYLRFALRCLKQVKNICPNRGFMMIYYDRELKKSPTKQHTSYAYPTVEDWILSFKKQTVPRAPGLVFLSAANAKHQPLAPGTEATVTRDPRKNEKMGGDLAK